MSFGLFEAADVESRLKEERRELAETRFAQAFADVESRLGPALYVSADLREFRDKVSLMRGDIERVSGRYFESGPVVEALARKLEEKYARISRTADHWRDDEDFLRFLVDRAGTVEVTDSQLIELLEEYAGLSQPSTPEVATFSTPTASEEGVSANPLGLSSYLKFCSDNDLDWSDPVSISLFDQSGVSNVDIEALYGWQEAEVEERKESQRGSAAWEDESTRQRESYRLRQGEFDYIVSQASEGGFILMKVEAGTTGERETDVKELYGHFSTAKRAQRQIVAGGSGRLDFTSYEDRGTGYSTRVTLDVDGYEKGVILSPSSEEVDTFYPSDGKYFSDGEEEEALVNFLEDLGEDAYDYRRDYLSKKATRKQANGGWQRDNRLDAFVSSSDSDFSCRCGRKIEVPSYSTCECGRVWNSYRISSEESSLYVAREVPRRDVQLASRSAKKRGHRKTASVVDYLKQKGWTSVATEGMDVDSPSGSVSYFYFDQSIRVWDDMGMEVEYVDTSTMSEPKIFETCLALEEEYADKDWYA